MIKEIREKQCKVKHGITKKEKKYTINLVVKYHIVIISDTNISRKEIKNNIYGIKELKNISVYTLTSKRHPILMKRKS